MIGGADAGNAGTRDQHVAAWIEPVRVFERHVKAVVLDRHQAVVGEEGDRYDAAEGKEPLGVRDSAQKDIHSVHSQRPGDRAFDELLCELLGRVLDLLLGALVDDLAAVQQNDVVADVEAGFDVVADHDAG